MCSFCADSKDDFHFLIFHNIEEEKRLLVTEMLHLIRA